LGAALAVLAGAVGALVHRRLGTAPDALAHAAVDLVLGVGALAHGSRSLVFSNSNADRGPRRRRTIVGDPAESTAKDLALSLGKPWLCQGGSTSDCRGLRPHCKYIGDRLADNLWVAEGHGEVPRVHRAHLAARHRRRQVAIEAALARMLFRQ